MAMEQAWVRKSSYTALGIDMEVGANRERGPRASTGRRCCRGRRWRWLAIAVVAAGAAAAISFSGSAAVRSVVPGASFSGLSAEVGAALMRRACSLAPGPPTSLDGSVRGKCSGTAAMQDRCPGWLPEECPYKFPMPYMLGGYPDAYSHKGDFPSGFVWGMGTAAYQIEGAYREDGRGASIWDTFTGADTVGMPGANCSYCCKKPPCAINEGMAAKGATGNVATDHYHMYMSDIALMKSMGLKHYRFSISWSRVIPTGKKRDGVNRKGVAFYNRLIDGLLQAGITPYVTLYHWDLPQGLLDPPKEQGWWSRDEAGRPDGKIMQDWLNYVELCFSEFGDRIKMWITFNEAWTFLYLGSGYGKAPSIPEYSNMSLDPYIGGHNVLNAHAAAVDLYRRKFQKTQGGMIGITNNGDWREPSSILSQDIAAAEREVLAQLGWFTEPIFGKHGDYPPELRKIWGDRLPEFTPEQRRLLNGSADFLGLNHYGTAYSTYDASSAGDRLLYVKESHRGIPRAESSWLYGAGWGFRKILVWLAKRYTNPRVYVTEAGWSLAAKSAKEGSEDMARIEYFANYTSEMRNAIYVDGVDVQGFFGWSLLDNFEWNMGYMERFGLVYTDYDLGHDARAPANRNSQPTAGRQWRRRKDSSCWFEVVCRENRLVDPADPRHATCVSKEIFEGAFHDAATGCKHTIALVSAANGSATVSTVSGEGCKLRHSAGVRRSQQATARLSGGSIMLHLSRSKRLLGYWDASSKRITWEDGTYWSAAAAAAGNGSQVFEKIRVLGG